MDKIEHLYILIEKQEAAIIKGWTQIASGNCTENEVVIEEMKELLINNKP